MRDEFFSPEVSESQTTRVGSGDGGKKSISHVKSQYIFLYTCLQNYLLVSI